MHCVSSLVRIFMLRTLAKFQLPVNLCKGAIIWLEAGLQAWKKIAKSKNKWKCTKLPWIDSPCEFLTLARCDSSFWDRLWRKFAKSSHSALRELAPTTSRRQSLPVPWLYPLCQTHRRPRDNNACRTTIIIITWCLRRGHLPSRTSSHWPQLRIGQIWLRLRDIAIITSTPRSGPNNAC